MDGGRVTYQGRRLQQRMLATDRPLTITRVAVGDGHIPPGNTAEEMTELGNRVMDAMITGKQFIDDAAQPNSAVMRVVAQISSVGVAVGFNLTEVAVYAQDPDTDRDVLYEYFDFSEHPQYIYPNGASSVVTLCQLELDTVLSGVELIVWINPSALATLGDLSRYALIGHRHAIGDIDGLEERLYSLEDAIRLYGTIYNNGLVDPTEFTVTFWGLDGVQVNDGTWDAAHGVMTA